MISNNFRNGSVVWQYTFHLVKDLWRAEVRKLRMRKEEALGAQVNKISIGHFSYEDKKAYLKFYDGSGNGYFVITDDQWVIRMAAKLNLGSLNLYSQFVSHINKLQSLGFSVKKNNSSHIIQINTCCTPGRLEKYV